MKTYFNEINYDIIHVFKKLSDTKCFSSLESITTLNESEMSSNSVDEVREDLENFFLSKGWEGNGDIKCFYMPPFFTNSNVTHCEKIFHVKLKNESSLLAIPKNLEIIMPQTSHDHEEVLSLY